MVLHGAAAPATARAGPSEGVRPPGGPREPRCYSLSGRSRATLAVISATRRGVTKEHSGAAANKGTQAQRLQLAPHGRGETCEGDVPNGGGRACWRLPMRGYHAHEAPLSH